MSKNKTKEIQFFRQDRLFVKFPNGDIYEAHRAEPSTEWDCSMMHTFFARLMNALWDKEQIIVERNVIKHVERTEELP